MTNKLVIVESPNKIKKIKSILGNGYEVKASVGHFRDLPTNELGINRQNNYARIYVIDETKKNIVAELMRETKKVGRENVLLATDPDREGEAIAFHLAETLGINKNEVCRVTFQEISEKAINNAINNPRKINMDLVSAQETRRVVDRLAGYEISSILNKKIENKNNQKLTAGRVQSVALKMVVEREREITKFIPIEKYKLKAIFRTENSGIITANYRGDELNKEEVLKYFNNLKLSKFSISDKTSNIVSKNPKPAFTTSTLQQDGIRKFKWSAKKVMEVAQRLFEGGHITYMRTDSPNLSEEAIDEIKNYLINNNKADLFDRKIYKVDKNAQEAHEAIRPTHFQEQMAGATEEENKLYTLIYLRAIASQMKAAEFIQQTVTIHDTVVGYVFESVKMVLKDKGYLTVYNEVEEEDENFMDSSDSGNLYHSIAIGQSLKMQSMKSAGMYSSPKKRFDEASLVKALEDNGIGRPSTYASILNNIIVRNYVSTKTISPDIKSIQVQEIDQEYNIKTFEDKQKIGGDKDKLQPEPVGYIIIDFLEQYFKEILNYNFTAEIEKSLDEITESKTTLLNVITKFDKVHNDCIKSTEGLINRQEPKTNLLGNFNNLPIRTGTSEKGFYMVHNNKFYKIETLEISLDQAIELIKASNSKEVNIGNYTILDGQFGLYMKDKKGISTPLKFLNKTIQEIKEMSAGDLSEIAKKHQAYKSKMKK